MEARLIVKVSGWVWKATLRFASSGTSPDSLFPSRCPQTAVETAARETKAVREINTSRIPKTIDCRYARFSESPSSGSHRRSRRDPRPLSIETVLQKADTSGSEEGIRNTRNARSGTRKLSASPAALSFHTVSHDPPACRSRSTDACGRERRKSAFLQVGATPTTFSDNPSPVHSAPALQMQ